MNRLNGTDFVHAIESLLSKQSLDAQETKQVMMLRLLGDFARKNGVPVQSGALSAITKCLRTLDAGALRQVRSLSDMLLNKPEAELLQSLEELRAEFMPIEARIHQVKTRSAFVAAALRPFSQKYMSQMSVSRADVNIEQVIGTIEGLASNEIRDLEAFTAWTRRVADLFESLVIYRGPDAGDFYTRPAGTVTQRSSRTYLQAWLSFTEKFKNEIWAIAQSGQLEATYEFKLSRADDLQPDLRPGVDLKGRLPGKSVRTTTQSAGSLPSFQNVSQVPEPAWQRPENRTPDKLTVQVQSKADPTAEATCNWDTREDFEVDVKNWVNGLSEVWGELASELTATVSVGGPTQSSVSLPSFALSEAATKLSLAVTVLLR